jgi:hypothetical protein
MKSVSAIQLLRDDQKTIRGLVAQARAAEARAPGMRDGVLRELCMMAEIHAQLEEELLYPALEGNGELAQLAGKGREELAAIRRQLPLAGESDAGFQELASLLLEHFTAEERDLFGRAEAIGPGIGQRLLARREELLQDPRYQGARSQDVQNPRGGEQMRKPDAA